MTRKQIRNTLILMIFLALFLVPSGARVRQTEKIDYGPSTRTAEPTVPPTATPEPTPSPAPTPSPTAGTYELLRKKDGGTKPDEVSRLQERLRELGFFVGTVDGYFGDETFNALVSFQRVNGLQGDGIAGQETQRLLYESGDVLDATGRVYVSADRLAITPHPSATPSPTPMALPLDDFSCGSRPLSDYFVTGGYHDESIRVEITTEEFSGALITGALVTVSDVSQLRAGLAGTLESPASAPLSEIADDYRAVIAIAGDNYPLIKDGFEARQGFALGTENGSKNDLLIIDNAGVFRVFTALGRESGLETYRQSAYFACSGGKALLINGVLQSDLDDATPRRLTAIGQVSEKQYFVASAFSGESRPGTTENELAAFMRGKGCAQAYLISSGETSGIYYAGSMVSDGVSAPRRVNDILYFASIRTERED